MKKEIVENIILDYLKIFPLERNRVKLLKQYLKTTPEHSLCDWNNIEGHLTAGAFIYSKNTKKFLVLWHKDLKMFLYPGGHCENNHKTPFETAKSEVIEETGINNFKSVKLFKSQTIPIDIDTHVIPFNSRINMPEHLHFDFRYLFVVDNEGKVTVDQNELSSYKWIDEKELSADKNYGAIIKKLKIFI